VVSIDPLLIGSVAIGIALLLPLAAKKREAISKINKEEVFCRTGLMVLSEEDKALLALKMAKAGYKEKPEHMWGRKVIYTGSYILIIATLSLLFKLSIGLFLFLMLGCILAWIYPSMQLNNVIAQRKSATLKDLSTFSMYLSTALNSVSNVPRALHEAGKATRGVYEEEIDITLMETNSGKTLTDALYDWAQRVEVEEINSLVSALDQIHTKGVPAAEKMKEYSDRIRMTRRFEIMEQAGKLSIKLIFVVLMFMLVPTMLVIGYPAAYNLMQVL
jgi:tight adherence protein C